MTDFQCPLVIRQLALCESAALGSIKSWAADGGQLEPTERRRFTNRWGQHLARAVGSKHLVRQLLRKCCIPA